MKIFAWVLILSAMALICVVVYPDSHFSQAVYKECKTEITGDALDAVDIDEFCGCVGHNATVLAKIPNKVKFAYVGDYEASYKAAATTQVLQTATKMCFDVIHPEFDVK